MRLVSQGFPDPFDYSERRFQLIEVQIFALESNHRGY